jgi:hypothetical protein
LLKMQDLSPTEIKKIQTNFKRASTENKNLRQKNKELIQKAIDLQDFYDTHSEQVNRLKRSNQEIQKFNLRWKIGLVISWLVILFLMMVKVNIHIEF